jgi:methyltransferase
MVPSTSLVLTLVAVVAAQRLAELALARHWLRHTAAETGATLEREPAYAWMVALHAGWLVGCAAEPLLVPRPVSPALAWAMVGLWGATLALRGWTLLTLGRHWHVRVVRRAAQPVATAGPYRWIRHPNYLAVVLELVALPLLLGAYATALLAGLVNAGVLAARIHREEGYLMSLPAYRAAFAHKARFIPGLF